MRWTRLHDDRLEGTAIVLFGLFILVCVLSGT